MPTIRHLAFRCQDPHAMGDFLHEALGLEILYVNDDTGTSVLSDGETNITLNSERFEFPWHFGLEMPLEKIEELRPKLEEMGVEMRQGVPDGRPVEDFIHTPEGHRIDLAAYWPTKHGEPRRLTERAPVG